MERKFVTCRELIELIAEYLEGTLDADTRALFERHLANCPSCREYLSSYRVTMVLANEALEATADDVPEELVQAILARRR